MRQNRSVRVHARQIYALNIVGFEFFKRYTLKYIITSLYKL